MKLNPWNFKISWPNEKWIKTIKCLNPGFTIFYLFKIQILLFSVSKTFIELIVLSKHQYCYLKKLKAIFTSNVTEHLKMIKADTVFTGDQRMSEDIRVVWITRSNLFLPSGPGSVSFSQEINLMGWWVMYTTCWFSLPSCFFIIPVSYLKKSGSFWSGQALGVTLVNVETRIMSLKPIGLARPTSVQWKKSVMEYEKNL